MKSSTWCACVIAMLLISPVAFGEIVETGGQDQGGDAGNIVNNWYAAGIYATASGDDDYVENWADGWMFTYTTVRILGDWVLKAYAFNQVELYLHVGDWAAASAGARGTGNCPHGSVAQQAGCNLEETGQPGKLYYYAYDIGSEGDEGDYDADTNWFDPYQGVSGTHDAVVVAQIEVGSNCIAEGHSDARGWGTLYVRYTP